jgi:hypothetical protein
MSDESDRVKSQENDEGAEKDDVEAHLLRRGNEEKVEDKESDDVEAHARLRRAKQQ